ncbi:MarR family winged helix-turn-helix transcriptional regulator [Pseudoduganella rhizocola]|uniref:MarR family winged helix-turn-helix transcriptional regulator n=1 Tax=Pseudoduganella rhizocola TaxID=3382643 RepID=UPI0038B47103
MKKQVSHLESHLGFWLRFVSNHVSGRFARLMEENGVSVSEWVALRQLYDAGEASAAQLMDALGMTKGAVSKIVTRLEQKGLAQREGSVADGRAQVIALTRSGRALVPKLAALADQNDELFFSALNGQQRRMLMQMMQQLVRVHELKQVPVE